MLHCPRLDCGGNLLTVDRNLLTCLLCARYYTLIGGFILSAT